MASNPSKPIHKFKLVAAGEVFTRTELKLIDTSNDNSVVSQSSFRKDRVYETDDYATILAISEDSRFEIIQDEAPTIEKPSAPVVEEPKTPPAPDSKKGGDNK